MKYPLLEGLLMGDSVEKVVTFFLWSGAFVAVALVSGIGWLIYFAIVN